MGNRYLRRLLCPDAIAQVSDHLSIVRHQRGKTGSPTRAGMQP
jgi:hypothetical protein